MCGEPLDGCLDIEHASGEAVAADDAAVSTLSAGLGVERGDVEHEVEGVARRGPGDGVPVGDEAADARVRGEPVVADELGPAPVEQLRVGAQIGAAALLRLRVRACALTLLLHE